MPEVEKVPDTVKTRDIKKALEEYAQQIGCPIDEIDFEVISSELVGPENDRYYLEAKIEITLKVTGIITIFDCIVEIEERHRQSFAHLKVLPTFRMQLSAEQLKGEEDRVKLTDAQKKELIKETKKLLLLEGVIYGHLPDDTIAERWEKALHYVYKVKKPYKFKVAEGKPPQDPFRREIYYIPLKTPAGKVINERTGRIDFKDRGYTDKKVLSGDRVATIEYIPGEHGITVTGKVIPFVDLEPLPFKVDEESIEVKEYSKGGKVIYDLIAKIDGYVYIEKGTIGISKFVKEKQVDYSTGNIVFEDKGVDIEVAVQGDRSIHDAVKDDFKLISPGKTVLVKGNVGRKAVVEGKDVVIEGVVAKDAVVKAQTCKITRVVGGTVIAEKAYVDNAVNASIDAEEAFAGVISGTTVRGKRVVALKALRHSTIYAYDFICVEEARDFNQLIINPLEVPVVKKELDELQKRIKEKEKEKGFRESTLRKIDSKIEGQLNLFVSYMRPTLKEKATKVKALIKSLLSTPEKLEPIKEKFPSYAKSIVDDVVKRHNEKLQKQKEIEEIEREIEEINQLIDEIHSRPGKVLVLDKLEQDNLIMMGKSKLYYTQTVKGPVLFLQEGDSIQEERSFETIADLLKEHLEEDYINTLREYLLEAGLRSYITKMKL